MSVPSSASSAEPMQRFEVLACPPAGVNLVEASAGTGKTWNICGLYLRLLLERGLEVRQILVVTFTNAATAELRERVRSRIVEALAYVRAQSPAADAFVTDLVAALERRGLSQRDMEQRLELALQSFDEAAILTIHGWCQRALAETPFAAGLPFVHEIQPDDKALRLAAVHDFWRRHVAGDGCPPALAAWLDAQRVTPEKLDKVLARHLAKPLAHVRWPADIDAPLTVDGDALDAAFARARATWLEARDDIVAAVAKAQPSLGRGYTAKSIVQAAVEWDQWLGHDAYAPVKGKKLQLFTSTCLQAKNPAGGPRHAFFDEADALLALRRDAEPQLERARLRLVRRLLDEAGMALREGKREARVAAYDDLLRNLYDALHAPAGGELARLLRTRYPAALIDEFQDTDPVQFAIFRAIYAPGGAAAAAGTPGGAATAAGAPGGAAAAAGVPGDTAAATGEAAPPLFLVGDPKQAIYAFRNADLHTYLHAASGAQGRFTLTDNQRSTAALIGAVNGLFGANARAFMLDGLDYHAVREGARPRKPLTDRAGVQPGLRLWLLPRADSSAPLERRTAYEAATRATAAEIARLLRASAAGDIELGGAPLAPHDIAVLVRTHRQGAMVKEALAALGVGSGELSRATVFKSSDAEDVARVLAAVLAPGDDRLLRAALATELIGLDARAIAALDADDARASEFAQRFAGYRDLWTTHGVAVMYRNLLAGESAAARMLARPDGERRLTNLLHLGELLHAAAQTHRAPDALLRWLDTQRSDDAADEAAQLRLESDRNLVQIVTIHKVKGLEYAVVFCPYLWDGYRHTSGRDVEGRQYHDATGNAVIDFRNDEELGDDKAGIDDGILIESCAEDLRLIYVALTRASHRCYLVAGTYARMYFGKPSFKESGRGLLNWLVAGNGCEPAQWIDAGGAPGSIDDAWARFGETHAPDAGHVPLPDEPGVAVATGRPDGTALEALTPPSRIAPPWRIGSFSALYHGATAEAAASDHDAGVAPADAGSPAVETADAGPPAVETADGEAFDAALLREHPRWRVPQDLPADDILRFPRGIAAGDCLHAALERADFADPRTWDTAIARALRDHPLSLPGVPSHAQQPMLQRMMARMLDHLVRTELTHGIRLGEVARARRLAELAFNLPAQVSASRLNAVLKALGYPVAPLAFPRLEGYLAGYIDLVFEHGGRYYVLDWKSNHLGYTPADYAQPALAGAMAQHGYHLQALLYAVALTRYLARRIPGYRHERHFGGVLYLFVRGVRPPWKDASGTPTGVHFDRPDAATLEHLEAMLDAPQAGATA